MSSIQLIQAIRSEGTSTRLPKGQWRLDDQGAQRPRIVVDEESADVTDVAVDRRDPVGADQARALQTRVTLSPAGGLRRGAALRTRSPEESAERPGVRHRVALTEQRDLAPAERLVGVHARTAPDLLAAQADDDLAARPIGVANRNRRQQNPPTRQPVARVDDEITHGPVPVVEVDVVHAPDVAVGRMKSESDEVLELLHHRIHRTDRA